MIGDRVRRMGEDQCGIVLDERLRGWKVELLVQWGTADRRPVTEWIHRVALAPYTDPVRG